jgi:hypothetical protein
MWPTLSMPATRSRKPRTNTRKCGIQPAHQSLPTVVSVSLPPAIDHVIAGDRHGIDALRELYLENHVGSPAKADLAQHQIELPHPAEALVIKPADLVPARPETRAPMPQRFRVMEPQNFDIGDEQSAVFDYGENLG